MPEPDGLEPRVAALEVTVAELREQRRRDEDRTRRAELDAAAARVLAGGADRDTSDLRTEVREFREQNTRVLNAMREDITDLRRHVDTGFEQIKQEFAEVNRGFLQIRGVLDATAAGQQRIITRLNANAAVQQQIITRLTRLMPPDEPGR